LVLENFERDPEDTFGDDPTQVRSWSLPLILRFFARGGAFAKLAVTPVWHEIERLPTSTAKTGKDDFVLVDVGVGALLPRRTGQVLFEVRNLFDQEFSFYDINFFSPEPRSPRFLPTTTMTFSVSLSF
jgi:hypothetical protein